MRHTIQALVENKFGVLARVASLFSARGYNISSLAVGETQDPAISCMTILVNAEDERILEQIKKQLYKLIDVIKVIDFTRREYIDRELMLIKLVKGKNQKDLKKVEANKSVRVIEDKKDYKIIEICADKEEIGDIFKILNKFEIKELVRTGKIAMAK
ncbi:MAG: acetolactate synthase small subunit [Candidatus Omnitrophica bacterium]|nr:acetolactate synthase small subunit [Candidatus Omnitrophota bacterium]MCF7892260.1 acetolactate synthase small subunit [Candidatus Omnitrophota bacterium]MCF7897606.1 acetolactate synthase small subunit [Candidatus Omnitrophota bacterium]MCF7909578.1 acetolactate synthase small subunit [Candidatus Omnitrophota bacterium]